MFAFGHLISVNPRCFRLACSTLLEKTPGIPFDWIHCAASLTSDQVAYCSIWPISHRFDVVELKRQHKSILTNEIKIKARLLGFKWDQRLSQSELKTAADVDSFG